MAKEEKGYVYILTNPAFRENWVKIVEHFEDVKVKIVDSFEDIKIKLVEHFEGVKK